MEVVRVPGHPVVAVVDVRICVVPGPVHKLHGRDVVGNVNENCDQTHRERLSVFGEIQSGDSVHRMVNECGI